MVEAYEVIADSLRARIRAGELKPGDRLPSEDRLAEEYRRSLPTVREALHVLGDEGIVERQHGRGAFVRLPRTRVCRSNSRHQWEKDRARRPEAERRMAGSTEHDTGLCPADLVFHASYQATGADKDIADVFGVPEGTLVLLRRYRTRYATENAPFGLTVSHLLRELVAGNPDLLDETREPWPGGTQSQLGTVGIELGRVVDRVIARPSTPEEAEELELPPGTPVILLRKTSYDVDDRVVEVSDVTLPGDRTELLFTTALARW